MQYFDQSSVHTLSNSRITIVKYNYRCKIPPPCPLMSATDAPAQAIYFYIEIINLASKFKMLD